MRLGQSRRRAFLWLSGMRRFLEPNEAKSGATKDARTPTLREAQSGLSGAKRLEREGVFSAAFVLRKAWQSNAIGVSQRDGCSPEGTFENSPTFQRWDWVRETTSPEGTAELRVQTDPLARVQRPCGAAGHIRTCDLSRGDTTGNCRF